MAWSISDLIPPWGDSGERPSDNFQYDGGDQVNEKHLDYLWTQVGELEKETRSALADIDSDKDGVVDEADDAVNVTATYKGNDIDTDGDGVVNRADELSATFVGDGLKGGNASAIDIEPADFAGVGVADDGSDNIELDESVIKDGNGKEIDAAEFAGGLGSVNQVLRTDGSVASWGTAPTTDLSNNGSVVVTETDDINIAGDELTATDDTDGTGTVQFSTEQKRAEVLSRTMPWGY